MLYIDIGNTSIKLKVKEKNSWRSELRKSTSEAADVAGFINRAGKKVIGVSVVKEASDTILDNLQNRELIRFLRPDDIPKQTLDYENPQTMGMDRYMACLGARSKSETAVIVIDAGTACTIDYMDDRGVYRGGVIMPGMTLWEKSLQQYAPALPKVERDIPMRWPGKNTEDSVRWGITGAFVEAVNGLVRKYDMLAKVWVTGGDADWLGKRLERSVKTDDNLVFDGIHTFMERQLWFG